MSAAQHTPTPAVPAGMVVVTHDEFYAALRADKRDIMPTVEAREHTPWRVVATRAMWGWHSIGYASKFGAPDVYAIAKVTGSAS